MGYLNNDGLNKVFTKLKSQLDLKQDVLQVCYTNNTSTPSSTSYYTKIATITSGGATGFLILNDNHHEFDVARSRSSILAYSVGAFGDVFLSNLKWLAVSTIHDAIEGPDSMDEEAYALMDNPFIIGKVSTDGNSYELYFNNTFKRTSSSFDTMISQIINVPLSGADNITLLSNQPYVDASDWTDITKPAFSTVAKYAVNAGSSELASAALVLCNSDMLDLLSEGTSSKPVYFTNGVPVACAHTLEADVPADAKFTDTTYSNATTTTAGLMSAADKVALDGKANASHTHTKDDITSVNASAITGVIDSSNLPSYVDDVLEYTNYNSFPATGESGKIYVDKATNLTYRWSGSTYVEISPSLALGETSSTAYRGDRGKTAYEHATSDEGVQLASGLYKITTGSEGHITAGTAVSKDDITALGIPAQDTTYSAATAAASGLMTSEMYTKLNGLENTVVENALTSTSTTNALSAAQGKALNDAVVDINSSLTAVNKALDAKVPNTRKVNGKELSSDINLAKADLGLGSVDNTADASKSVLSASKWTTPRTLTIGNKGNTVDGSGNVSWSLSDIGAAASSHNHNTSYFALASTNNATGNQWLNNGTIDGGDYTSSSTLYGYSFGFKDKNSNTIGQIRTIQATNLLTEVEARRTVGSNIYYNYLRVGLSKTGEQLYQLSSPSAFRSAIGITSGTAAPASSGTAGSIYIQYS